MRDENEIMIFMTILDVLSILIFLTGCQTVNDKSGINDDDTIEEVVEEIILKETGVEIDLTPRSKE